MGTALPQASRTVRTSGGLGRRAFVCGVGLAASLPVIVSTVRALVDGWMPLGDQGIIATRAYDVFSTHMPLLGQYSEASTVTRQPTYSPGPLLYWLLALPTHVGSPWSLIVTVAVLNVACIVGVVALAERRGGRALAVLTGAAVALTCLSLATESLHDIFNPSAALFPLMLLFPLCWSLACGDYKLLPLTVLVASFAAQCQLGFVPPVAAMLVVGLVGLAIARRGRWGRPVRRWAVAALGVAVICWSAPVAQQIWGHPGNFGVLAKEVRVHQTTQGATRGTRVLVRAIGVRPRWLRPPQTHAGRLTNMSGGDYGDTRLSDLSTVPGLITRATAALVVAALALLGLVAWRRRRGDVVAAAALALALCAALVAVVAETPIRATNTLGYMLWWGSVVGMWTWVTLAWSVVTLAWRPSPRSRPRLAALAAPTGALIVLVAGVTVAVVQKPDTHTPFYRPTRTLAAGLDRALAPGTNVRLSQRGGKAVAIEPAIRFTLRRRGVRALGPYASRRPGAWYELDHRPFRYAVSVNGDHAPPYTPARVVARAVLTDSRGRHRLTATVSPPNARSKSLTDRGQTPKRK